jgi:hypothetical protein
MTDTTDFYLTEDDNEVLLKGNLNKTDWIVYIRLRLFENSEEKPDVQEMIQISGYTAKTFYKSLKKLKGLDLSPVWADSLLPTAQEKN